MMSTNYNRRREAERDEERTGAGELLGVSGVVKRGSTVLLSQQDCSAMRQAARKQCGLGELVTASLT